MSEAAISIKGLRKTFKDFWLRPVAEAVRGIDLEVPAGEVFGLLGPNGSGKSTTIKMILGLLAPTAGEVRVFGDLPRSKRARGRIGYLPELSHLHPFLTARETLHYYAGLSGMKGADAKRRADELLEQVKLTAAADRTVGGFSKGMARRVALASALVAKPELLIMDEPTSGLDPIGTREVKMLIRELSAAGVTILMTSHLMADTADVCGRLAILDRGKVAASGRTEELLTRRGDVRFTLSGLGEEEAGRLKAELEGRYGGVVGVDHPTVPLEDFFAETINK